MDNPYQVHHVNATLRTRQLNKKFKEKDESIKEKFHGFLSSRDMDMEYAQLMNQKYLKSKSSIVNLTSEELKQEYTNKYNYFKSGIKFMFLLSIMFVSNSLVEFKYLKPSELNIAILILSIISVGFCIMLIINLNSKVLIDSFGYLAFYLLSVIEAFLFVFIITLKLYNFIFILKEIYIRITCKNKIKFPKISSFLFLLLFNIILFSGFVFCFKFIWNLFLEGFNTLMKREKTLFQKQLELNLIEKNDKNRKIEFVEEESLDSNGGNTSKDNMKIE